MTTERTSDIPVLPIDDELAESLLRALDELDAPLADAQEPGAPWRIADQAQADWAARKLTRTRAKLAEVRSLAERQRAAILAAIQPHVDRINEWETQEAEHLMRESGHWEALLGSYHRSVLADDERAKTIRLPHATLVARKQPDTWETDDAVLIEWATKAGADIVRTKVEIDRREMKKSLSVASNGVVVWGGEMVPGVTVVPGEVKFAVETEEVTK